MYHLDEMARIGKLGNYDVVVYTDDAGMIPHFHILSKDKIFDCCIKIETAEYFHHNRHNDVLNSKERKDLMALLQSKSKRFNMTNWEYLLKLWNDNNSDVEVSEDLPLPDYRTMKESTIREVIVDSIN